jgi:hypothetical protein
MILTGLPRAISRYLVVCCMLVACNNHSPTTKTGSSKKVEIKKENGAYRLYKDGEPFFVKGGAGYTHLQELAACGGNTIRTWDTVRLMAILEEARRYNLSVIVGLDLPESGLLEFYNDQEKVEQLYTAYRSIIRRFRDHPSLLAWCPGNELDFPYRLKYDPFYKVFNNVIKMIHAEDPGHPVTTALANFEKRSIVNIKTKVSGLDFISINTFNLLKTLRKDLSKFKWFWNGPYLVTEWSPDGGWETENITKWQTPIENTSTRRAELIAEFYHRYLPLNDRRFLGSLVFYWGSREEFTHTWFSVFNENGIPTEVMEVLHDCWNDTVTKHQAVKIIYMLLDERSAADNILLAPGSAHQASVLLPPGESSKGLHFNWEIIQEDWFGDKDPNRKKPAPEIGLIRDSTVQQVTFSGPLKEGPYRIFVTVTDAKGFCATANTPFYVVE